MAKEFAPGIPAGRVIKSIPKVSPKSPNQDWDVSLSLHPAAVRGDHYDLRLVDPKGRAHSWAMKEMPDPGKGTYAAQVATHSKSYALRKKPWKIPPGYGATRPGKLVEPVYVQKAEVVQAGNDKVRFLRHHGQETDEFVLKKIDSQGKQPLWALNNATKNRHTIEGKKLPSSKPKYKEIKPEQVDFSDVGQVMTPKLDGAHVLVDMKGPGAPMRVYSYRPTDRKTGLIEHTFKFPDFNKRVSTPKTKNTLIRAELWASGYSGKAIPAEQVGGLLNAGVLKSRAKQQEGNVQLRLTGIDVIKHKGKNYENKDFSEKLKALRTITRGSKGAIEMPPIARTAEEKQRLLGEIKGGQFPDTKEGVVLHRIDKLAPPTKVKLKNQDDVYVREVFTKKRGRARGHGGGFAYSVTPDGPIVGRVGTGFNHKMRKDMFENPDKYVGRVAKVNSQGPYSSGALRAPSFDEWHIDKTPPELMKEGAGRVYHYGPKDVDLSAVGLGTPATLRDPAAEKYKQRASEDLGREASTEDVIDWLEETRGPGGSRMGSVIHEPIGKHSTPEQQAYAGRRQLYGIDYDRAVREGAIEGAHVVEESPMSKRPVRRRDLLSELGKAKGFEPDNRRLVFQGAPHGFITIKDGTLPGKYLKKEGASELYHGSPKRLKRLDPRDEHGDPDVPSAVFGAPSRSFALAYTGKKWGDRDINQGIMYADPAGEKVKEMYLREMRPGALKDIYGKQKGYMHILPTEGFEETTRPGAKWEQINKSSVVPSRIEEIEDAYKALEEDPLIKFYEYDPKDPATRKEIKRSVRRMNEMDVEKARNYRNWRLGGVPKEIQDMFKEEMLKKESQSDTLKALKEYKQKALEEISPDDVANVVRLADDKTRMGGAAGLGINLAKEHLEERYPGELEARISKAKSGVRNVARKGIKQTAGFVKGLGD